MAQRLIDSDRQRERRNQQLLQERLSRSAERQIAKEIRNSTRDMVKRWETMGDVPDPGEHARRTEALLKRIWQAAIEGMGKRINEAAKARDLPAISKQEDAFELYLSEFIASYGGDKIVQITETTREQIMAQVARGREEGLGQKEIAKRIRNNASSIGLTRAAVIARTETHTAGNYGAQKAAERTGLKMRKEWIAASQPERTRSTHREADEQTVPMDDPFTVGGASLRYPGDPRGPARETVNCRCAVGYITDDS